MYHSAGHQNKVKWILEEKTNILFESTISGKQKLEKREMKENQSYRGLHWTGYSIVTNIPYCFYWRTLSQRSYWTLEPSVLRIGRVNLFVGFYNQSLPSMSSCSWIIPTSPKQLLQKPVPNRLTMASWYHTSQWTLTCSFLPADLWAALVTMGDKHILLFFIP